MSAVLNMAVTDQANSNGCLAFWSGTRQVDITALQAIADTIGVVVPAVGAQAAMRRTLAAMCGSEDILVDVDARTLAVVHRAVLGPDKDLDFVERCRATVVYPDKVDVLVESEGFEADTVKRNVAKSMGTYQATDVGVFMSRTVIPHFAGVPLRERGGVYLVPTDRVKAWTDFADLVRTLGCCMCHSIPVAYGDRFVQLAVDAISRHVESELRLIRDAVETGNLGAKALQWRITHDVTDIERTIGAYHDLLGGAAAELKQSAEDVRQYLEAALMMAEGEKLRRAREKRSA